MTLITITPPTVYPWTAAELGTRLRQDIGASDSAYAQEQALYTALIKSATAKAEAYLRARLITQTVRLVQSGFGAALCPEIGPVQSITAVKYIDGAGVEQTIDAADYQLVISRTPNFIAPAYGKTWPVPRLDHDSVTADLVVGYGDAATDVPDDIRHAILLIAADMYEHREDSVVGAPVAQIPNHALTWLAPHRWWF